MDEPTTDRAPPSSATRSVPSGTTSTRRAPPGPTFNLAALLTKAAVWGLFEDRTFPEFSDLVIAARHCARRACVFGLAIAVTFSAIAWVLVPGEYEAVSYLQVRRQENFLFPNEESQPDDAKFVLRQEQRVRGKTVLDEALKRSEVVPFIHKLPDRDSLAWIRGRMHVDLQAGAELMSISFVHSSPDVALAFNTAVTNAYVEEYMRTITADRQRQLLELERAAKQADHVLNEYWTQLQGLADQVGSSSTEQLTVRDQIELQSYREYAIQLRRAQSHSNQLRSQLANAQLQLAKTLPTSDIEKVIAKHPELVSKQEQLDQLDDQLQQMRQVVARQDSPRLIRLQATRDLVANEVKALHEQLCKDSRYQLVDRQREIHGAEVEQINKQIELNADEIAYTRDVLAKLESQIERTGENNGARLEMVRRTIDRQTRLTDGLWRALERRKIEARTLPRVAVLETAQLPQVANRRNQFKAVCAAGLGGLLLTVLVVGFVEWRSCRVRQPHDVVLRTGLSLFGLGHFSPGISPWRPSRRMQRDVMLSGINEVVAYATRRTATPRPTPVIFVSSATESEPRHVAALELALGFSHNGLRTLLIDADLEGNQLARLCNLHDQPGLRQLVDDSARVQHSVLRTSICDLDVLPKGTSSKESVGYAPRALARVLEQLLPDYDAVVVLGPPILTTPDSVLIASRVNAALFATEMGQSRWNLLAAARQRLAYAGIELLGAVLCDLDSPTTTFQAKPRIEADEHVSVVV